MSAELESAIGWTFQDGSWLSLALTHRSYCAENPDSEPNERLEFLGDAILGVVVTDFIYREFPELAEGELAKLRASVVNADTLADVAREIDLGTHLKLGKGEEASGGRDKPSILADACEAVIAAMYLDGGFDAVWPAVIKLFEDKVRDAGAGPGGGDYKTRLQELSARLVSELPRYEIEASGPDHAREFRAQVFLRGELRGSGSGRSKKQAEQAAARAAWESLAEGALLTAEGGNDA